MGEGEFDLLGIYTHRNCTVAQIHGALCYVLLLWKYYSDKYSTCTCTKRIRAM